MSVVLFKPPGNIRVFTPPTDRVAWRSSQRIRGDRMSTATMADKRLPRSLSGCLQPPSAEPALDPSLLVPAQMSYRSTGLGFYAIAVRCCTMPLEKLAMIMNSAQVSGQGQMRQARSLTRSRTPTRP